jgi:hypothetical protein
MDDDRGLKASDEKTQDFLAQGFRQRAAGKGKGRKLSNGASD